jgi:hypothetical protein
MPEIFIEFKTKVENKSGKQIKILSTDGGGEYQGAVAAYLKKEGIIYETTASYTSEQNGISEQANRTLFEQVRVILTETNLPKIL